MTRKDYQLIAETIRQEVDYLADHDSAYCGNARLMTLQVVTHNLSKRLSDDNPKFNADKFASACGL